MADKKVSALPISTAVTGDDLFMIVNSPSGVPTSQKITVANLFNDIPVATIHTGTVVARANVAVSGSIMNISANSTFTGDMRVTASTPASSNTTSEQVGIGKIWFDHNYLYVATNATTIKRVLLSEF
jgi:hypothetical protein|tara:strand:- start:443 stop:823 length:381 start_codon:yes stop_codon:yes gene_type:complete